MSYTLDMAKFNCVVAGRRLKNISEFQRSDDGEKGTTSDPDIYGNVVVTDKANKMAEFEVTVLNRSDDHDLLEKYYQERRNFTFSYIAQQNRLFFTTFICMRVQLLISESLQRTVSLINISSE